jgi:hypothetical protein
MRKTRNVQLAVSFDLKYIFRANVITENNTHPGNARRTQFFMNDSKLRDRLPDVEYQWAGAYAFGFA